MRVDLINNKVFIDLICLLTVLTGVVIGRASASEPLTLNQCISMGLGANLELKAGDLILMESKEGVREAWGAFLPSLRFDYNHNDLKNDTEGESDYDYLSQRNDSFSVSLSQPLFRGYSNIAGLRKARDVREYNRQQIEQLKMELILDVQSNFYQMLQGQLLIGKWEESLARLKRQEEIASVSVREKLATKLRLLEVSVEIANAEQNLASARSLLKVAEAKLKELLALDAGAELSVIGDLTKSFVNVPSSLEESLNAAYTNRPELNLAALNVSIARNELKEIRGRNLPHASFDAAWVDYSRDYDEDFLDSDKRDYYSLSLNVSICPFQGGKNIFAYRRQVLKIKRLETELQKQKNAITTEAQTAFERMKSAVTQLNSAKKEMEEANEAFLFAEQATTLEIGSLDTLLDAELRLTQAEINHINSLNELCQAEIGFQYSIGAGRMNAE